jgi:DNA-binding Lrp family transcriptional regulator
LAITGISVVVGALFSYTHNLLFGRQLLEPENYNVYNRMVDLVIHELVSDGTITKQQQKESTADDPEQRYEATQKQVYGPYDFIVKLSDYDMDAIRESIGKDMTRIRGIQSTVTLIAE